MSSKGNLYLFIFRYYLWEISNYRHWLVSLHLDDSKIYHIQHLHLLVYVNEYTDHVLVYVNEYTTSSSSSYCISLLLPLIEERYAYLALYTCLIVVQLLALCSFIVRRIFFWFDHWLFHITNNNFFILSWPLYGCPMNDLVNAWLWLPHINFTIHLSPPNIGFARNLKGHPHFLLLVIVRTKPFMYALYFSLLSQPIKTYEVLPLFLVYVSDLIITVTKPISYATKQAQCKTSSRVANTYKRDNTCLVFNTHSFTYLKKIQNHINTWEVWKTSEQLIFSNTPGSSSLSLFILTSSDIMFSYLHWSSSILTKH